MNKKEQEQLVQKICNQYIGHEHTELDALKKLDRKVKTPANVFAYIFGSGSALIMGAGMSLIMTDISESIGLAEPMLPGLIIGIAGMLMALLTYPVYKNILNRRRKRAAGEILALSEKITRE